MFYNGGFILFKMSEYTFYIFITHANGPPASTDCTISNIYLNNIDICYTGIICCTREFYFNFVTFFIPIYQECGFYKFLSPETGFEYAGCPHETLLILNVNCTKIMSPRVLRYHAKSFKFCCMYYWYVLAASLFWCKCLFV